MLPGLPQLNAQTLSCDYGYFPVLILLRFHIAPGRDRRLFRKLQGIEDATSDKGLACAAAHRFEKLRGNLTAFSIRVNDQWRLVFRWVGRRGEAEGVYLDDPNLSFQLKYLDHLAVIDIDNSEPTIPSNFATSPLSRYARRAASFWNDGATIA